jgi:hypothetical protein
LATNGEEVVRADGGVQQVKADNRGVGRDGDAAGEGRPFDADVGDEAAHQDDFGEACRVRVGLLLGARDGVLLGHEAGEVVVDGDEAPLERAPGRIDELHKADGQQLRRHHGEGHRWNGIGKGPRHPRPQAREPRAVDVTGARVGVGEDVAVLADDEGDARVAAGGEGERARAREAEMGRGVTSQALEQRGRALLHRGDDDLPEGVDVGGEVGRALDRDLVRCRRVRDGVRAGKGDRDLGRPADAEGQALTGD